MFLPEIIASITQLGLDGNSFHPDFFQSLLYDIGTFGKHSKGV